jgi:hypothetical protein
METYLFVPTEVPEGTPAQSATDAEEPQGTGGLPLLMAGGCNGPDSGPPSRKPVRRAKSEYSAQTSRHYPHRATDLELTEPPGSNSRDSGRGHTQSRNDGVTPEDQGLSFPSGRLVLGANAGPSLIPGVDGLQVAWYTQAGSRGSPQQQQQQQQSSQGTAVQVLLAGLVQQGTAPPAPCTAPGALGSPAPAKEQPQTFKVEASPSVTANVLPHAQGGNFSMAPSVAAGAAAPPAPAPGAGLTSTVAGGVRARAARQVELPSDYIILENQTFGQQHQQHHQQHQAPPSTRGQVLQLGHGIGGGFGLGVGAPLATIESCTEVMSASTVAPPQTHR